MDSLFDNIINGCFDETLISEELVKMYQRGIRCDELEAAIRTLRKYTIRFEHKKAFCFDTCGTGGDGKSTVNVSSAVSIILSSLGIPVVKHGNVSQSGIMGSANILMDIGIPVNLNYTDACRYFHENDFIFLFAPIYQPAMKKVASVRAKIKGPTIFNYVGPLLNPANPEYQIIGINRCDLLYAYASAAERLNTQNAIIYSSLDGFDEVSSEASTICCIIKDSCKKFFIIEPHTFFNSFPMPVVKDRQNAVDLFMSGLSGKDENLTNLFSINAALGLHLLYGMDLNGAFCKIKEHLKGGAVLSKLANLKKGITYA
jgi:anthranilate phosphoribosyltransferase